MPVRVFELFLKSRGLGLLTCIYLTTITYLFSFNEIPKYSLLETQKLYRESSGKAKIPLKVDYSGKLTWLDGAKMGKW